jgi:hypothetical protein
VEAVTLLLCSDMTDAHRAGEVLAATFSDLEELATEAERLVKLRHSPQQDALHIPKTVEHL